MCGPRAAPYARAMTHRVLIAEDAAEIRQLVRLLLEADARFEVVGEARNGREAIQMAEELRPDAVILDLAMPVVDGFRAIPQLRVVSPETKILVFSALPHQEVAELVKAAGAHAFLPKPTGTRRVVSTLAELCLA